MRFPQAIAIFALVSIVFAGAAGVAYSGMLMGHADMGMAVCPLMGHDAAVCTMNPLEHAGLWQVMFAAVPPEILVILLAASVFTYGVTLVRELSVPAPPLAYEFSYAEARPRAPLQEFIARGLLHPKPF